MNDKFRYCFSSFYCETCSADLLQNDSESYEECAEKGKQAGWYVSDELAVLFGVTPP